MPDKYYLTTPLYYVNAKPHIGHSYTNIAADTLARFERLRLGKENVFFLTGTDEHGQKIARAAQAAGEEPKAFTDRISLTFRELWKTLNISYDDFIRTTEPRHKEAVQAVWRDLEKRGEIYTATYSGYYCTPCETFLTEETVRQQQEAGQTEILCPDCKRPAERIEETNFFFKISPYQDWLIGLIEGKDSKSKMQILPDTRRNEVLGFLRNNKLQDLCISRPKNRLAWGIESPLSKDHVTYVWFDALINYISACGYGDAQQAERFKKWWPADVHLIGKDILRHHAVYWPILLHALGLEPPRLIFAHGWWVQGGQKMSKSLGNITDPVEIVKKYGVDPYRYFLLSEAPFGQDGTFSEEALISRFNTDLANDLGNLLHRTLTMCEKYFQGRVPDFVAAPEGSIIAMEAVALKSSRDILYKKIEASMRTLAFSEALQAIWSLINQANKFIEQSAPWTLYKEKRDAELKTVIIALAELLKAIAQLLWPFMPETAEAIWKQLGINSHIDSGIDWTDARHTMSGIQVAKGAPLFPRIETDKEKVAGKN